MNRKELVKALESNFKADDTVTIIDVKKLFSVDTVKVKVAELFAKGKDWDSISEEVGIARSSVANKIKELKIEHGSQNNIDLIISLVLAGYDGIKSKNIELTADEVKFLHRVVNNQDTGLTRDKTYTTVKSLCKKLGLDNKRELMSYTAQVLVKEGRIANYGL